jgi:signal transduction histidine kinase
MPLFLDAPIEELKLSRRVRNALHLAGLHTLRSVLASDDRPGIRGFGPAARSELRSALEAKGFAWPVRLVPPDADTAAGEIAHLLAQMEEGFAMWGVRLEYFEMRLRALAARSVCPCQPPERARACLALAHQFRTRLTNIRAITATLHDVLELPPDQHELVELIEEQSVRMSVLVYRFLELFAEESFSNGSKNGPLAQEAWKDLIPELAAGYESLLAARGR